MKELSLDDAFDKFFTDFQELTEAFVELSNNTEENKMFEIITKEELLKLPQENKQELFNEKVDATLRHYDRRIRAAWLDSQKSITSNVSEMDEEVLKILKKQLSDAGYHVRLYNDKSKLHEGRFLEVEIE